MIEQNSALSLPKMGNLPSFLWQTYHSRYREFLGPCSIFWQQICSGVEFLSQKLIRVKQQTGFTPQKLEFAQCSLYVQRMMAGIRLSIALKDGPKTRSIGQVMRQAATILTCAGSHQRLLA